MRKSVWLAVATISLSLLFVYACEEDPASPTAGPTTYWEAESYSAVCEDYDGDDFMPFNLTYPTPGSSFKVGDTVVLGICYEPNEGSLSGETVTLIKEVDGSSKELRIVSLADDDMTEDQIQSMENGKLVWVIPESFPEVEGGGSIAGDSLMIRLATYPGMFSSEYEYGPFIITE